MKFIVKTYGCQMNERDSDSVSSLLLKHGFTVAEKESQADLVIVNTCSIRGKAEDKALGKLRLLVLDKEQNPGRIVGAIGCMVQRLKQEIFEQVPGLDFAVGTRRLATVPAVIARVMEAQGPVLDAAEGDENCDGLNGHQPGGFSAFVNILFGCNRRCSYCIVPTVRGREWSRPGPGIVEEVRELVAGGVKEVTLLGQSVMSYGKVNEVWPADHKSPRGFHEPLPRLLEMLSGLEGLERLRFMSGHPSGCTDELIRAMVELDPVCEHLHLPLQSGSDRILKLMRRGYTTDEYRQAVSRLRAALPDICITTDFIIGFPTETVEDFELTRRMLVEIGFDNSFIFKYSPRPGTEAGDLGDDVTAGEKAKRNGILLLDQDRIAQEINERMVGTVVDVMVEGMGRKSFSRWSGRTRAGKIVVFEPVEGVVRGDIVNARIERAMPYTVYGKIV